jgi:ribonuclease HII
MALDLASLKITEIRERVSRRKASLGLLRLLAQDARPGVRRIGEALRRRIAEERRESRRIGRLQKRERGLWESGLRRVAGVDEAGIGPLAGPVVAAAVVLEPGVRIRGIDDSKKLTAEERRTLLDEIRARAQGIGVGVAEVSEIDALNIYHAGLLAMRRAVLSLPVKPEFILSDARVIPEVPCPQEGVIHGDANCFSIAAASIVAKTHRDSLMEELDLAYPQYGFARHKGYSTPEHRRALLSHGPCPIHRQSFLYVGEVCGECAPLFYACLNQLETAESLHQLDTLEKQWEVVFDELSRYEQRKLRQRILRRRKRLRVGRSARHG